MDLKFNTSITLYDSLEGDFDWGHCSESK